VHGHKLASRKLRFTAAVSQAVDIMLGLMLPCLKLFT